MAKNVTTTEVVRPSAWTARGRMMHNLLAATTPADTNFANSDYVEVPWYGQVTLYISYTKGDSTSLDIRPQFAHGLTTADALTEPSETTGFFDMPSVGSQSTASGVTTRTINIVEDRRTHSGSVAADIDRYALEYPINTRFFRVRYRMNGAVTGSPSVTIVALFGWS